MEVIYLIGTFILQLFWLFVWITKSLILWSKYLIEKLFWLIVEATLWFYRFTLSSFQWASLLSDRLLGPASQQEFKHLSCSILLCIFQWLLILYLVERIVSYFTHQSCSIEKYRPEIVIIPERRENYYAWVRRTNCNNLPPNVSDPYNNHDHLKRSYEFRIDAENVKARMKAQRVEGYEYLDTYCNREMRKWFVGNRYD